MVVGFGLLVAAMLLISAGISGRSLAEVVRGEVGRGFALADIRLPDILTVAEPAAAAAPASYTGPAPDISTGGGARAIVEAAAAIGRRHGATVVSDYRPGDNDSDHGWNDAHRAARDIATPGIDAIKGPPSPNLDAAVVEIGRMFGRSYTAGRTIIDTFHWHGFRVQILWRTPLYGGHMGHIHVGAREE